MLIFYGVTVIMTLSLYDPARTFCSGAIRPNNPKFKGVVCKKAIGPVPNWIPGLPLPKIWVRLGSLKRL
jgi:hypothetical protein